MKNFYGVLFTLISVLFVACTDVGDRDNIYDSAGEHYHDVLYDLNRNGNGYEGEIRKIFSVYYIYDGLWRIATELEYNTYDYENNEPWKVGKQGEIRKGTVSEDFYALYDKGWREATELEKNTYDFSENKPWPSGKDGDVRLGSLDVDSCYVFENDVWRKGNKTDCTLGVRECTVLRQGSVKYGAGYTWYKCDSKLWRIATELEYDTYQVECSKEGNMFRGKVNAEKKYVCDNEKMRAAGSLEASIDSACTSYNRNVVYESPEPDAIFYRCTEHGWDVVGKE